MDATVLIPTHDHGPLLEFAVRSVLRQTVQSFEIFVVGDGVPPSVRADVERIIALDPRIRFFDFPKRGRTGVPHRNAVLSEATGRVVCYLADDDLWLPHHLESMIALLGDADFAHGLTVRIHPDGRREVLVVDVGQSELRALVVGGSSRIHLASAGHTMALFRRLPGGWIEAPPDLPTDYFMWRRILERDDVRAVSGHRPSVIVFPSPLRAGWPPEKRLAEVSEWSGRLGDPGFAAQVDAWAFSAMCEAWFEQYREAGRRLETLERVHSTAVDLRRQLDEKERLLNSSRLRWWQRLARTSAGRAESP
jgi:glycosyltransferase involved in cell wall biosynthesis